MGARYGPQPPTRSSRPGQAVTLLGHPPTPGGPDMAPTPHTFVASRPSRDAPRSPAHSGGPRDGPQNPHTFVASRLSRDAPRSPAHSGGPRYMTPIAMGWRPPRRMKWG